MVGREELPDPFLPLLSRLGLLLHGVVDRQLGEHLDGVLLPPVHVLGGPALGRSEPHEDGPSPALRLRGLRRAIGGAVPGTVRPSGPALEEVGVSGPRDLPAGRAALAFGHRNLRDPALHERR